MLILLYMTYTYEKQQTVPYNYAGELGALASGGTFHDFTKPVPEGTIVTSVLSEAMPGRQLEVHAPTVYGEVPTYDAPLVTAV